MNRYQPTIGRIVHYTFPTDAALGINEPAGQSRTVPAIIVQVFSDTCVNLQVFPDGDRELLWLTSRCYREGAQPEGDYWEWPTKS